MQELVCAECQKVFKPKPMGYNAKYCSYLCKCRKKIRHIRATKPEQLVNARYRSWKKIQNDPEKRRKHNDQSNYGHSKTRKWLAEYKLSIGCIDCGYKEHYAALQLDHEGPKSIEIANARSSVKRLQDEIEKGQCKVRCANCHSVKTWERKQKGYSQ